MAAPADHDDYDLQAVINSWDTLPAAVKAGILAMVKASVPEKKDR